MERVHWTEFDVTKLHDIQPLERGKGNPGSSKSRPDYLPIIATFDTETSTYYTEHKLHNGQIEKQPHAFVYIWMFYLPYIDTLVYGRTINDYRDFAERLSDQLRAVLICFCHNLSFDWTFLDSVYEFKNDPEPEVFSVKPRKILIASMFKIEHRCSMLLSNLSLDSYTKQMGVEHKKLSGKDFNYDKLRFPWTELDEKTEWPYVINDVVGLAEAVQKEIEISKKDLYHFPFTSTGFVRQDLRQAVRHISDGLFRQMQPTYEVYKALRQAFRGGDTHANRLYAGQPISRPGYSYDRSSSYPDVQCNHLFPMTPFKRVENTDVFNVLERRKKYKKALLMKVKFTEIRLKVKNWGFPYISTDLNKVSLPPYDRENHIDYVETDNGRVLYSPWVIMTITDVDLDIILNEYTFDDMVVIDCWESRYGKLPPAFTDVVRYYYGMKTKLKGVKKQSDDELDPQIIYNLMKARLNAVYGCTAQDIIKADLCYDWAKHEWKECLWDKKTNKYIELPWETDKDQAEHMIFDEKIKSAWLPYQLACWTTAWARYELHCGLHNVADQGGVPLYCDTDSVKYIGDWVKWDDLNKRLRESSIANDAYADDANGERHYMGVWEKEGKFEHSFERFSTLGAKKYCYEELEEVDGKIIPKLHVTIAAVTKKDGAKELAEKGGLDRFAICRHKHNELKFVKAGGTALIYNDDDDFDVEIDGHTLHIGRNVVITDDTYTLSLSDDYSALVDKNGEFLEGPIDEA